MTSTGLPRVYTGDSVSEFTRLYVPPVPEFVVERVELPAGSSTTLSNPPCPAVLLITSGSGAVDGQGARLLSLNAAFLDAVPVLVVIECVCVLVADLTTGSSLLQPCGVTATLSSGSAAMQAYRVYINTAAE